MNYLDRRSFLAAGAAAVPMMGVAPSQRSSAGAGQPAERRAPTGDRRTPPQPVAVSSRNGIPAVNEAVTLMQQGVDPAEAAVEGVSIVEDDPADMTVGYGGLPNENGVVQLDASVMHGPSHKAGAVAAMENIRYAGRVALHVLRRTNHTMLVGEGAKKFALANGFKEENLLTEPARDAWLRWRRELSRRDDWLPEEQRGDTDIIPLRDREDIPFTDGTIHCAAVNTNGDLGAVTSTSGLSYKISGRVGDSPIIGAGCFVDNLVGAAGATGRGESVIKSCGAFQVVQRMDRGDEPTEACLKVLKWIANHTRRKRLLNEHGEPNFQVVLYALRKDGAYGSACMRKGRTFTVHDGTASRTEACVCLYE